MRKAFRMEVTFRAIRMERHPITGIITRVVLKDSFLSRFPVTSSARISDEVSRVVSADDITAERSAATSNPSAQGGRNDVPGNIKPFSLAGGISFPAVIPRKVSI